jgi:cell division protein FtsW (lipid II flippase)
MKKSITLKGIDIRLLLLILILLAYGSVMVFSASGPYAKSNHGDEYYLSADKYFGRYLA